MPEYGLDCLVCAEFAGQRNAQPYPPKPWQALATAIRLAKQAMASGHIPPEVRKLALTGVCVPNRLDSDFRSNSAHMRQSRPDSGLDFEVTGLKTF